MKGDAPVGEVPGRQGQSCCGSAAGFFRASRGVVHAVLGYTPSQKPEHCKGGPASAKALCAGPSNSSPHCCIALSTDCQD